MKKQIVLGITAFTLAATLVPIDVKAADVNYMKLGNSKQVIYVGGNCDVNQLPDQIQEYIQSIIDTITQNGCGNIENKPDNGTEDVPNVESPDTDNPKPDVPDANVPNTDVPDANVPNTDVPDTNTPNTDAPDTDDENAQNPADLSYAQQVLDLVNAERLKEGLAPLKYDADITNAANLRAIEIQSVFSHTRPNGSSFYTVFTEQEISYRRCGENIAYGQKTPQEVVAGWMNSAGHRANIMDKNYSNIGIGYQVKNGTAYWVQLFTQ